MRGVPDIAYQASSRTGVLVYLTEGNTTASGPGCSGGSPCSTGWYTVGGTSASAPQWAGLIAIADQMAGRDLGFINPALYAIANNPAKYAADFYDPHVNDNGCCGEPGWPASTGWDAVTGLGTPNAAKLIPDLIAPAIETASRPLRASSQLKPRERRILSAIFCIVASSSTTRISWFMRRLLAFYSDPTSGEPRWSGLPVRSTPSRRIAGYDR